MDLCKQAKPINECVSYTMHALDLGLRGYY